MKKRETTVPFGLLFEESAPQPRNQVEPTYDEETDISYVIDSEKRKIPYVECGSFTGTNTATKVYRETTDTDPGEDQTRFSVEGTTTVTRIKQESTDTDPENDHSCFFGALATESVTLVQAEATDTDPENDCVRPSKVPFGGTDTLTEVKKENTDRD
jgi:hypothetical protein